MRKIRELGSLPSDAFDKYQGLTLSQVLVVMDTVHVHVHVCIVKCTCTLYSRWCDHSVHALYITLCFD